MLNWGKNKLIITLVKEDMFIDCESQPQYICHNVQVRCREWKIQDFQVRHALTKQNEKVIFVL